MGDRLRTIPGEWFPNWTLPMKSSMLSTRTLGRVDVHEESSLLGDNLRILIELLERRHPESKRGGGWGGKDGEKGMMGTAASAVRGYLRNS